MKKLSKITGAVILCAMMLFPLAAYAGSSVDANNVGEGPFKTKVSKTVGHGNKVFLQARCLTRPKRITI